MKRLPSPADGHPRVVARLAGAHGVTTDFVQDELVVEGRRAAAARLAERWHGKVLASDSLRDGGGETHLIRVDASRAPTAGLAADLIRIDPRARGAFKVSSPAGLGLVAVAADAAAHGLKVAPNLLTEGAGVRERSTAEGAVPANKPADPPWTLNGFGPGIHDPRHGRCVARAGDRRQVDQPRQAGRARRRVLERWPAGTSRPLRRAPTTSPTR